MKHLTQKQKAKKAKKIMANGFSEQDIIFEPGEGREYSNFGYALLGMIIEKASGMTYEELLQKNQNKYL